MVQFLKKRSVYHCLIWLVSYLSFVIMEYFTPGAEAGIRAIMTAPFSFFISVIPVTYLAFWAKEYFFDNRKYILYFFTIVAVAVFGVLIRNVFEAGLDQVRIPRLDEILNYSFIQVFVLGLQYFKRGIVNQQQIQELRAKTAMIELNTLKAQLNPHFLFNTLNNIHGMNQEDSEKASEMIMELSDVMRYHLEFSKESKVKLRDEIQLLSSYIKLEKLRLTETCDVKTSFEDADVGLMISPLLFLPFVENAFKHGTHPNNQCYVHIELKTKKNELYFNVKNSVVVDRKVVKTNIGLENTKRRLELIFQDKYELKITKNEQEYLVEMYLEL